ncbi:hypothetical protein GCM10010912_64170 [Paenibacillus albidus]|uniref:Rpn family recombination-promoting nuclease/putative transposase n=1 Tax=Paenibacillus albidus TaxID=2041023 RepID=A0A917FW96_9BACL|nr:hypothetical protein GCM10010912_64170 [Paenibacillus albidus]
MLKCVTINILNYSFLPNDRYHSVFHLREDYTNLMLIDDIEIHFIELTKLNHHTPPVEGGLINWLLFLKGADKSIWEVLTLNDPHLKKAMDTLEFLSQDNEARRLYEERQKFLHDEASMIEWATEKGLEAGRAAGHAAGQAEGERKKALEIARNMLSLGIEIKLIAQASGLTEAEILSLKNNQ